MRNRLTLNESNLRRNLVSNVIVDKEKGDLLVLTLARHPGGFSHEQGAIVLASFSDFPPKVYKAGPELLN
jgi:hypothetical protein